MLISGFNTLYDYIHNLDLPDGEYELKLSNNEIINIDLYNYSGVVALRESTLFGTGIDDDNMVVVKVKGDLTLTRGTFSTRARKKGLLLYVSGTFTNNATLSMSGKGALTQGQNVLLWKDDEGNYDIVPAECSIGGAGVSYSLYKSKSEQGNNGASSQNRGTGGGGSGSTCVNILVNNKVVRSQSGSGSTGTSYSGGLGGGSVYATSGTVKATDATNLSPGQGRGTGTADGASPGGGLLILYCGKLVNNGQITSNGVNSRSTKYGSGASGGGSINIFYNILTTLGSITANGGQSIGTDVLGGNGGNGAVIPKQIEFVSISTIITAPILEKILKATLKQLADTSQFNYLTEEECDVLINNVMTSGGTL